MILRTFCSEEFEQNKKKKFLNRIAKICSISIPPEWLFLALTKDVNVHFDD